MIARYKKIFSLEPNIHSYGCSIILEAGALQYDTKTGAVIGQLKMRNIGRKVITSCKVSLKAYDGNGKEIEGVNGFPYLDINAANGMEFGSKVPIKMPDRNVRGFEVSIDEIVFEDGSVDNTIYNVWEKIAASNDEDNYEQQKAAEEAARLAEQQKAAEEAARLAEQQKAAEEAARLAEQQKAAEEAARLAEQQKATEEAARLAEQQKAAEEAARLAEQQKAAEEATRLAEQQKDAEEAARLAEQQKAAEEDAKLAEQQKAIDDVSYNSLTDDQKKLLNTESDKNLSTTVTQDAVSSDFEQTASLPKEKAAIFDDKDDIQPNFENDDRQQEQKKKHKIIIGAVCGIVALLIIFAIFSGSSNKKEIVFEDYTFKVPTAFELNGNDAQSASYIIQSDTGGTVLQFHAMDYYEDESTFESQKYFLLLNVVQAMSDDLAMDSQGYYNGSLSGYQVKGKIDMLYDENDNHASKIIIVNLTETVGTTESYISSFESIIRSAKKYE